MIQPQQVPYFMSRDRLQIKKSPRRRGARAENGSGIEHDIGLDDLAFELDRPAELVKVAALEEVADAVPELLRSMQAIDDAVVLGEGLVPLLAEDRVGRANDAGEEGEQSRAQILHG